jgi:hypothetical protein
MVKVGKFGTRNLAFAVNDASPAYGMNSPIKRMWWGTVTKIREDGTAQTINFRGATWGYSWIEYAEVYSRPFSGTSAGGSLSAASVQHYYNKNPTLFLGATLGVENTHLLVRVWGR